MDQHERDSGIEAMLVGGYSRTPAFTRWSRSAEAEPILREWAKMFRPSGEGEFFAVDLAEEGRADRQREQLTADIEHRYGTLSLGSVSNADR